jgi:hypothetical protein
MALQPVQNKKECIKGIPGITYTSELTLLTASHPDITARQQQCIAVIVAVDGGRGQGGDPLPNRCLWVVHKCSVGSIFGEAASINVASRDSLLGSIQYEHLAIGQQHSVHEHTAAEEGRDGTL